jgi:hypothetical protein
MRGEVRGDDVRLGVEKQVRSWWESTTTLDHLTNIGMYTTHTHVDTQLVVEGRLIEYVVTIYLYLPLGCDAMNVKSVDPPKSSINSVQ